MGEFTSVSRGSVFTEEYFQGISVPTFLGVGPWNISELPPERICLLVCNLLGRCIDKVDRLFA